MKDALLVALIYIGIFLALTIFISLIDTAFGGFFAMLLGV